MIGISSTKFGILKLSYWLVYLSLHLLGGVAISNGEIILVAEQQCRCYKESAPVRGC